MRSELARLIAGTFLLGVVAGCSGGGAVPVGSRSQAGVSEPDMTTCTCSGVGANGPVTLNCGETTCGTDGSEYQCTPQYWVPTGNSCVPPAADLSGAPADMAGACTCSGVGINGPVTINCGQTTCGTDNSLYSCVSQDSWAPTGNPCPPPPDLTPPCTCSGVGINGPVTVNCGESTCGTDNNYWTCASQDLWTGPGGSCTAPPPDLSGGAPDLSGPTCTCSGVGLNGPVTVNCGESTCGTDSNLWTCNPGNTWSGPGGACNAPPDLSNPPQPDLSGGMCTCSGVSSSGPVTVNCGETTCGTDFHTWTCASQSLWTGPGAPCGAADLSGPCTCSGVGINGPVTVNCGQSTCGTDNNLWTCNTQDMWTGPGGPCP
jgi:hypothetical protein